MTRIRRKPIAVFFLALLFILLAAARSPLKLAAEDGITFGELTLSEDGVSAELTARFPDAFVARYDDISFFRLPIGSEGLLSILSPVASCPITENDVTFSLPFDASDASSVLYGYLPTVKTEDGRYQPLSNVIYLSDCGTLAENGGPYPAFSSKKGLQISLITDAQLLGVRHTVVPAFLNELVTEEETDAVSFVYGGIRYHLDRTALSALDYRITTLTKAGIHCYLELLLAYEPAAVSSLYEPGTAPSYGALCAPNLTTPDAMLRYAAVVHFLAARYTEPAAAYGFCGSFIVGYETDRSSVSHLTSAPDAASYLDRSAALLRVTDAAVRSAYREGRVYLSLSHGWNPPASEETPSFFGAKEFLTALAERDADVPFGVSINPYPSSLSMTDFWNDPKATDDPDTEIVSMKNLSVFTDYLKTDALLCEGRVRRALIGEFGVSGRSGGDDEATQAAASLLSYDVACQNEAIEAFIWHRQVDHAGERGLYFGLWSASDLLWEPQTAKAVRSVMAASDVRGREEAALRETYRALLPDSLRSIGDGTDSLTRTVVSVTELTDRTAFSRAVPILRLDFSKNLYQFYPGDNADYLETVTEDNASFLRARLFRVSAKEYAGIGGDITDVAAAGRADFLTVRLRVSAPDDRADVRLLLTGGGQSGDAFLDASSSVSCGEWTELTFPLSDFSDGDLSSCRLKIWMRPDSFSLIGENDLYLDVSSITFSAIPSRSALQTVFWVLILLAGAAIVALAVCFFVFRRRSGS